jgi:OmpA-OmpF porin, OOP family
MTGPFRVEGRLTGAIGHTGGSGSDEPNEQLSEARTGSVRRYLASHEPIAAHDTAEGRARNRRVEFRLQARDSR